MEARTRLVAASIANTISYQQYLDENDIHNVMYTIMSKNQIVSFPIV